MKVSLKKASILSKQLLAIEIPLVAEGTISIHQSGDPSARIEAVATNLGRSLNKGLALMSEGYAIRGAVGTENAKHNVHLLLSERAMIDKQLAAAKKIPVIDGEPDIPAIESKLEAMRAPAALGAYSRSEELRFRVKTTDILKPFFSRLKRRRVAIEDRLAEINHSVSIELPEETVALLREFDLI